MKKVLISLFCVFISTLNAQVTKTINVSTAGTLISLLTSIEKSTVTDLTVTGNISWEEIGTINQYMSALKVLNLSNATVPGNTVPNSQFYQNDILKLQSLILPNTITTIGNVAFAECQGLNEIILPTGLKSVGYYAFGGCNGITSIIFPNTVTNIGSEVFYKCKNLTSVTLSNSISKIEYSSFEGCIGIKSIIIPESVTDIGSYAFYGCTNLVDVNIPKLVANIGRMAFLDCLNLAKLNVSTENTVYTSIDGTLFDKSRKTLLLYLPGNLPNYIVPTGVTTIGESAFSGSATLKSVVLPNTVTEIKTEAFIGCESLELVTLPNSLQVIGEAAFSLCVNLPTITLPSSLSRIENYTFQNCSKLSSVSIPTSVSSIGMGAFVSCSNLKSIEIPNSVTTIEAAIFDGCTALTKVKLPTNLTTIPSKLFGNCIKLVDVQIPSTVSNMGNSVFYNCSSLKTISLPSGITDIQLQNFKGCTNLLSIEIPASVKTIGDYAFSDCKSLNTLKLSSSLTNIGDRSFYNCSKLKSIYSPKSFPPLATDSTFRNVNPDSCTLYIPTGSKANYTGSSPWSLFKHFVEIAVSGVKTINVATSGTLGALLTTTEKLTLSELIVTGNIDARDFRTLTRDMPALSSLDLSKTTVMEYTGNMGSSYVFEGVVKTYSAHTIPTGAFYNRQSIQYLSLPESIIAIESYFYDFTLSNCSFKNIILPSNLQSLGEYCFWYCTNLETINFPEQLSDIGKVNIFGCPRLKDIFIPKTLLSIGLQSLNNCGGNYTVDADNPNFSAQDGVLYNKNKTRLLRCGNNKTGEFNVPNGVTAIDTYSFAGCNNLTKVNLPSSLTLIEGKPFYWCSSMNSVNLPKNTAFSSNGLFYQCLELKSIYTESENPPTIENLFSVGPNNIDYYSNVTLVTPMHCSETYSKTGVWSNFKNFAELSKNGNNAIVNIKSGQMEIISQHLDPFSIESLNVSGEMNIDDFSTIKRKLGKLTSLNLNNVRISNGTNITDDIPQYALSGLEHLISLTLPSSTKSISIWALSGCKSLTNLVIPASVTQIGSNAFSYCEGLKEIFALSPMPVDLSNSVNVFGGVNKSTCTLYVPVGSKLLYSNADQWKDFLNIVETTTEIKQPKNTQFKIYPNPTTNYLHFSRVEESMLVDIYNLSGRLIISYKLNYESNTVDVSTLPKGIYLIKGFADSGVKFGKFVKE